MSETFSFTPHGRSGGMLITSNGSTSLASLDKTEVLKQLAECGYLLFRGFKTDMQDFSAFVHKLSVRVTLDPARTFNTASDVAQKVDAGYDALGLHCENGNSPFLPHLCWFFCEKAAKTGSYTTVCDGYRVWDELSQEARQAFAQDIVYHRNVERDKWQRFAFHMMKGSKPQAEITLDDLLALPYDTASTTISANEDGSIHYAFRTAAAHPTFFGQRLAFANSILGPSYHYEKPVISFVDGTPLGDALLAHIAEVSEQVTEDIAWVDGDVALIDNTRVMHGRRAILDPNRTIYNALSYIN